MPVGAAESRVDLEPMKNYAVFQWRLNNVCRRSNVLREDLEKMCSELEPHLRPRDQASVALVAHGAIKSIVQQGWQQLGTHSKALSLCNTRFQEIVKAGCEIEYGDTASQLLTQSKLTTINAVIQAAFKQRNALFDSLIALNRKYGNEVAPFGIPTVPKKSVVVKQKDVAGFIAGWGGALLCKGPLRAGFLMATVPSTLIRRTEPFFKEYETIGSFVTPALEVLENSPFTVPLLTFGVTSWAINKMIPQEVKNGAYNTVNRTYHTIVQLPTTAKKLGATVRKTCAYWTNWRNWCCCYFKRPAIIDSSMGKKPPSMRRRREPSAESTASQASGAATAAAAATRAAAPPTAVVTEVTDVTNAAAPAAAAPQPAPSLRDRAKGILDTGKEVFKTAGNVIRFVYTYRKPIGYTAGAIATVYAGNAAIHAGLNFWNTLDFEKITPNFPRMTAFDNMKFPQIMIS